MASAAEMKILISAQNDARRALEAARKNLQDVGAAADKANGPLSGLKDMMGGVAGAAKTMAIAAGVATAALGAGFVAAVIPAVKAAGDLSESINKTEVVFGTMADTMKGFSKGTAKSLGISQKDTLEYAATLGYLFKSVGMTDDIMAENSKTLVQRAADIASLNNLDPTEVLDKMRAGLIGESEPLRAVGVLLTEEAVALEAVEAGLAASTKEVSQAAKVQARYNLIMKQSAVAAGDFANTSKGLANSTRIMQARWKDLQTTFGTLFLPAVTNGMALLQEQLGKLSDWVEDNGPLLDEWANNISQGFQNAMDNIGRAWAELEPRLGTMLNWAKLVIDKVQQGDWSGLASLLGATIGEQLGNLGGLIMPRLPDWVQLVIAKIREGKWGEIGPVLGVKIGDGLATLGQHIGGIWEGIKAVLDKPLPAEVTASATNAGSLLGKTLAGALKSGISAGEAGGVAGVINMLTGELGQGIMLMAERGKELALAFKSGFTAEMTAAGIVLPKIEVPDIPGLKGITDFYKAVYDVSYNMDWGSLTTSIKDTAAATERLNRAMQGTADIITGQWKTGFDAAIKLWSEFLGGVNDTNAALDPTLKIALEVVKQKFEDLLSLGGKAFKSFWDTIVAGFSGIANAINLAAGALERWNALQGGGGGSGGGASIETSGIRLNVPPTASGGIVDGAQVRMVGEAGPEAIIPLDVMMGIEELAEVLDEEVGQPIAEAIAEIREAVIDGTRIITSQLKEVMSKTTQAVTQAILHPTGIFQYNGKQMYMEQYKQQNQGELGTYYTDEWRAVVVEAATALDGQTENIRESLPVIDGFRDLLSAAGDMVGEVSNNLEAFGEVVQGAIAAILAGGNGPNTENLPQFKIGGGYQGGEDPSQLGGNAAGGIVTKPILSSAGWIGEAGPEAIVPLDRLGGGMGTTVNVTVQSAIPYSPAQWRDVARQLQGYLAGQQRLGSSV